MRKNNQSLLSGIADSYSKTLDQHELGRSGWPGIASRTAHHTNKPRVLMWIESVPSHGVRNAPEARSRRSGETALQVIDDTRLMLTVARPLPVEWSGAQIQKAEALAPGDDRGHTPGVPEPNLALQI